MFVEDTAGFPPFGVVRIGAELVAYRSVDRNRSTLAVAGRAVRNTSFAFHPAGSTIAPASPVPDCTGEQGIGKDVVFSFLPSGCRPGIDCTGIRALVADLGRTAEADILITAIVELAHHLGLEVCAEGVETPSAWERLRELGCERAQGFLVSRPISGDDLLAWARTWPGIARPA